MLEIDAVLIVREGRECPSSTMVVDSITDIRGTSIVRDAGKLV